VRGELGEIVFTSYYDKTGYGYFAKQSGKSYYQTHGYQELVVFGVCSRSYRGSVSQYERLIHQKSRAEGVKKLTARTVQDQVESQGNLHSQVLEKLSASALVENGFDKLGNPVQDIDNQDIATENIDIIKAKYEEMYKAAPAHIQAHLVLNESAYESLKDSLNISIDDVCTKRQKATRRKKGEKVEKTRVCQEAKASLPPINGLVKRLYPKREQHYQTVIHLQRQGKDGGDYLLNGKGLPYLYPIVVAFCCSNQLLNLNWIFFTDGQRTLLESIMLRFAWKMNKKIILDYYHLQKKCQRQFSMAFHNDDKRAYNLNKVLQLLWYGLSTQAVTFLQNIDNQHIKNEEQKEILMQYITRNQDAIPCYELRKLIGLRNSSNTAEKANDTLVAKRQKHNGMSWSPNGSIALASLQAIVANKEHDLWLNEKKLRFSWALAA
jgi:hypothetical protein